MAQLAFGGNSLSGGFTDVWVESPVVTPAGRVAADGRTLALITGVQVYASGRTAGRTLTISFGGETTAAFAVAEAGSAQLTSLRSCSLLTVGVTVNLRITSNGSFYFGRGGEGTTVDNNGLSRSDGDLGGTFNYAQSPTAPRTPAVSATAAGEATLTWSTPSSNGEADINGYRIEYATNSSFTGASVINHGTSTSRVITGLTPGETYYFRVAAKNAVTDAGSTWSVWSSTVSTLLGTVPDAPTGLALVDGPASIHATWSAPASDGGLPITSYLLEWALDSGFTSGLQSVSLAATARAWSIYPLTPGTLYHVRVKAVNSIGASAASTSASDTVPVRGVLELVRDASVHVPGGAQVELRSDGANSPTVTLGFTAFGTGTTFASIATLAVNGGAGTFAARGGQRNLALVADAAGNLFVVGRDDGTPSSIRIQRYARTGTTNAWAASGASTQAVAAGNGQTLVDFAAAYVPGTGGSAVPSLLILARRVGAPGAGNLLGAVADVAAVAASSASPLLSATSDPSWLSAPPSSAAPNSSPVDAVPLVANGTRIAVLGDGFAVVDVVNGVVSSVSKAAASASTVTARGRVVGINASTFAVLVTNGSAALAWSFYSTGGSLLGSGTLAGSNANGGTFGDQWDAVYDSRVQTLGVYFLADSGSARQLERINVSPSTFVAGAIAVLTAALGAASSTNSAIRAARGPIDERRVIVAAANVLTDTKSTATYSDRTGNVAPNAPALVDEVGYDASTARVFSWGFSDPNAADTSTAYELEIQRVSDSVNVVATGKVASTASSRSVAGGTLVNGVAYRWRVRTYDVLDAVGAWSAYDTFSTSSLGTLTITSPAADNPAGLDVSSLTVTWSYSQADGYVQTQRRVRLVRVADSAVLSDTTMQASTATSHTVTNIPTDTPVRVEVSIVTNAPGTPTVGPTLRTLTTSYGSPMTPTAELEPGEAWVDVVVTNPTPTGSRPEVARNVIERRLTGSGAAFVPVGVAPRGGTYRDHAVRAGVGYDYRVRGATS